MNSLYMSTKKLSNILLLSFHYGQHLSKYLLSFYRYFYHLYNEQKRCLNYTDRKKQILWQGLRFYMVDLTLCIILFMYHIRTFMAHTKNTFNTQKIWKVNFGSDMGNQKFSFSKYIYLKPQDYSPQGYVLYIIHIFGLEVKE